MSLERRWVLRLALSFFLVGIWGFLLLWQGPMLLRGVIAVATGFTQLLLIFFDRMKVVIKAPEPLTMLESPEVLTARLEETVKPENYPKLTEMVEELRNAVLDLSNDVQEKALTKDSFQGIHDFVESSQFINENVYRAYEISDNLANTAKQAFELSENVQTGVKIVTESLSESLKFTELLFSQSKKISKILTIMSDISEKIHVLSINASIVSARAGVSGKGFEVVAKEIRNLAKETENSLSDIENVIAEVQLTIQNVIEKVEVAHKEAETEKGSLLSVAGSLQGVILAVEIIRAVSGVAKERGETQTDQINRSLDTATKNRKNEVLDEVATSFSEIGLRVEDLIQMLHACQEE